MGKRKSGLDVHGILLLDKRLGVSSNRALQEVRRLLNANKAGHTGSLDPLATGLLPLCFGEATKVSGLMLDDDKRYEVLVQLGVVTDTGDAEGQVIASQSVPDFTVAQIESCLGKFIGEIEQVPPMYSALKHQGKKLYELAREGQIIDRKPRQITIYKLELLEFTDCYLRLDVSCSKGTYIRSLAEDIGKDLGCGGTVKALRRTAAGQFDLGAAKSIEQLTAMTQDELRQSLLPVDLPLTDMPMLKLDSEQSRCVQQGQWLYGWRQEIQGLVRMYHADTFLGLGEIHLDGKLTPKKLFNLNN